MTASILIQTVQLLLSLSLLILLHEGGHCVFAKLFGIRVEKFYLFFDYKFSLFKFKPKNSDTEYGIGWIPLGGYCKISGMVDESFDIQQMEQPAQPWEFRTKPAWQRLLVMVGGVVVNFITAIVIYSAIMYTWGDDYIATRDMPGMQFNAEALSYGFQDGDIILGTNEGYIDKVHTDPNRFTELFAAVADATEVIVLRNGKEVTVEKPVISLLDMIKETPRFMDPIQKNEILDVAPDMPAAKAGMKAGSKILAIDGYETYTFNDINYRLGIKHDILINAKSKADSLKALETTFIVENNGKTDTLNVLLQVAEDGKSLLLGVTHEHFSANRISHDTYGLAGCIPAGISYGWNILGGYVNNLKYLASAEGAKSVGGFATIGSLFPKIFDWHAFWMMTAFLSIILAFMNIIPIPALDGGHVLFLIWEMVTGKVPSVKFMERVEVIGFAFVLGLMLWANIADGLRYLGIL